MLSSKCLLMTLSFFSISTWFLILAYININIILTLIVKIICKCCNIYSVSDSRREIELLYPAVVSHDSTVQWNYPQILRSACPLDVTYFPWDKQNCELEFGSWTYDGDSLDIVNKSDVGRNYLLPHGPLLISSLFLLFIGDFNSLTLIIIYFFYKVVCNYQVCNVLTNLIIYL